jgi:hypothetical protein
VVAPKDPAGESSAKLSALDTTMARGAVHVKEQVAPQATANDGDPMIQCAQV